MRDFNLWLKIPSFVRSPIETRLWLSVTEVPRHSDLALDIIERRIKLAAGRRLSQKTIDLGRYWGWIIEVDSEGRFQRFLDLPSRE